MKRHALTFILSTLAAQYLYASPVNYVTTNLVTSSMDSGLFDSTGIYDEFSMDASFTKTCLLLPINLNCTFSFNTRLYDDSNDNLVIELHDYTSTGPGLCSGWMNYGTGPTPAWRASIPHTDLPPSNDPPHPDFFKMVPFTLYDVVIPTSCGVCEGTLNGFYSNSGGGEIALYGGLSAPAEMPTGNCTLNGILKSNNFAYEIWH